MDAGQMMTTRSSDTQTQTSSHKERKKTDNPREGWEDGTPPPHRDFLRRGECGASRRPPLGVCLFLSLFAVCRRFSLCRGGGTREGFRRRSRDWPPPWLNIEPSGIPSRTIVGGLNAVTSLSLCPNLGAAWLWGGSHGRPSRVLRGSVLMNETIHTASSSGSGSWLESALPEEEAAVMSGAAASPNGLPQEGPRGSTPTGDGGAEHTTFGPHNPNWLEANPDFPRECSSVTTLWGESQRH